MTSAPKDQRIPFMVTRAELDAIDEWRFANRIPTRAAALRALVRRGLALEEILDLLRAFDLPEATSEDPNGPLLERFREIVEEMRSVLGRSDIGVG